VQVKVYTCTCTYCNLTTVSAPLSLSLSPYTFRLQLSALHFNENANRKQAVTKKGEERYDIVFPKYKKGGYIVRKIVQDPSYGRSLCMCMYIIFHYDT